MKHKTATGIMLTLLFTVTVTPSFGIFPSFAQNNVIVNGDFEKGSMEGWSGGDPPSPGATVIVQSSIVHGGSYALKIDTLNASSGDFVYQSVSPPCASFEFEFWIYRESGKGHCIELVRDWYSGHAYIVTSVWFRNDTVDFETWTHSREHGEGLSIPYILSSGTWHHVKVKANATYMKQKLFIDDVFVAEQTSTWTYPPEWIILGDITLAPQKGRFCYDDINLTRIPTLPVSEFTYTPYVPFVGEEITFNASSSYDLDGEIASYHWDFGDNSTATGMIVTHSYASEDSYIATLTATDNDGASVSASETVRVWKKWSFAIIADPQIGIDWGDDDYGSPGWNDTASGEEYSVTTHLRETVDYLNSATEEHNIRFVVVLGDLSDSAEMSEFNKAIEILNGLYVDWIPVIGNHDVWPYSGEEEASEEESDSYFNDLFAFQFEYLSTKFENWEKAPAPVWNSETNPNHNSSFQNFAFDYKDHHFICLDFNARDDAPFGQPGVAPEGDLHNFPGGTWDWFTEHLREYCEEHPESHENVILFAHHPFNQIPVSIMGFSQEELLTMYFFLEDYGDNIWGEFAGHTHKDDDCLWWGWLGTEKILHVVETGATCEGEGCRIVQIRYDGSIDYSELWPVGPGDVNHDGIVDIVDIVIVALAFGTKPGDPNWNPIADLNQDGTIDIVDIVIIAIHFGETR